MDFGLLVVLMMGIALFGLIAAVLYWFLRYSFGTDQEQAEMGEINRVKDSDKSQNG
ncbi:MAG: hypothetical protein R2827_06695 [Bdellovibrionales bacterium]